MAEHADPTDIGVSDVTVPPRVSAVRLAVALSAVALAVLCALGGWMGYRLAQDRQAVAQQVQFIEAARQGALNLTTIGHTTVDEDVKRILESSTGVFHDDFKKRSEPFADLVRQAQSTSEGSVTSAALESQQGDTAQVLVVMSVKMSTAGAPDQQDTRVWRMRVGVQRDGDTARVSDVQFI